MKLLKKIFFSSLFFFYLTPAFAQTRITDSLRHLVAITTNNKEKIEAVSKLSDQNLNPDTLLPYLLIAEEIAARSKNKLQVDQAAYIRSNYYVRKNYIDSALHIVELLIGNYKNNKDEQKFYLQLLFFKSKILDRANRFTESLTQLYSVLEIAEAKKDTLIQIQAKTGVGWVLMEMEQFKEALQWLYNALHTSANKKLYENYGALYSNIASTYNALGNTDSAKAYITIAIKDARKNDNLLFLATALNMQAKIFINSKQADLAEAPLNEAVIIRKKLNDPFYTVYDMSSLASYYATAGQTNKGIALCKEGITIATKSGLSSQLLMIYHSLAANYKQAGNNDEYGKTLELIIALKDSFNNINSSKLLADMKFASEAQKRETTIIRQKLDITIKNYWLYGSLLVLAFAVLLSYILFKSSRRKQKLRMEIMQRNSELAIKEAEEAERKRIAADLHDSLGAYAASIASNINHLYEVYIGRDKSILHELHSNSQAIVSQLSDTIWVLKKDALLLTSISDRLKVFIQKLGLSYPSVTMDICEVITTDHLLPPSQAFHLFQMIKEAVSNALKHSRCTQITIAIEGHDSWKVSISDNGRGMQVESILAGVGNGLANIRERAKESGWKIEWQPNKPAGTKVVIAPTTN